VSVAISPSMSPKEYARLPNPPSLRSYLEAVEITANRTGSLLSCEVEVAKRCLAQDPGAAARLPLRNKVRDLAGRVARDEQPGR